MEKEFSEFRESDKSLKHEFESIVSCWHCGSILVCKIRGGRFKSFYCNDKYFGTELAEFSENISGKLHCQQFALWIFPISYMNTANLNSLYMFPFLVRVANTTKNVHVTISSNGNIAIVVNLVCLSDYVTLSKPGLCIQRYPVKRSHWSGQFVWC